MAKAKSYNIQVPLKSVFLLLFVLLRGNDHLIEFQLIEIVFFLSNGHSPQIRRNGELLVRMCRMRVTVWRMSANVSSVKCIESGEKGWRMSVECSESGLSRVANLANLASVD